jgi:hypothetical protein
MDNRKVVPAPLGSAHDGRPRLIARYASMDDARKAIAHLEAHGVDGDDIALIGDPALMAERAQTWPRTDRRFLRTFKRWVAVGTAGGILVGAVVGAVIAGLLVLVGSDFPDNGWLFALIVAFFAVCGGLIGCYAVLLRRSAFSESWPLTFEEVPGEVWLAIYTDPDRVRRAVEATAALEMQVDPDIVTMHPDELRPPPQARPSRQAR